jgi:hypothetical protein
VGLPDDELLEELEELEDELLEEELLDEELLDDELLDEVLDEEEELEELEDAAPGLDPDDVDCPPQPVARIVTMTRGNNFVVIIITQSIDVVIVVCGPTPSSLSVSVGCENHTVKKYDF